MEFLFSEVYVYEEIPPPPPPHESCRESNIELLRVVAMLFVLIVHTDFLALGFPTPQDMAAAPGSVWAKIGFEFPALVCV